MIAELGDATDGWHKVVPRYVASAAVPLLNLVVRRAERIHMWRLVRLCVKLVFYTGLYVALAILTLVTLYDPNVRSKSPLNSYQWCMLFFMLIVVPGWILWKVIRRFRGKNDMVLPNGGHVLYLRPFSVDASLTNEAIRFLGRTFTWGPLRGDTTLELGVAAATRKVGTFVAIGRPSDFVTPDGAKRIYVGDESWQQKVGDLLRDAAAVIIVSGTTEGVVWEKQRIRECLDPRRLLLILPSTGIRERQRMAELSSRYLRTAIVLPSADRDDGGPLFYVFDAGWAPMHLPRQDSKAGARLLNFEILPRVIDFHRTLSPFVAGLTAKNLGKREVSKRDFK